MAEFNADELTWPDWLDQNFFTKVLRSYKNDQTIELSSFEIAPGTAKGDHFASVMYKIKVIFSSKKYQTGDEVINLIMKLLPTGEGFKAQMLKDSPLFKSEIKMYTSVIPEMERILSQNGDKIILAPP